MQKKETGSSTGIADGFNLDRMIRIALDLSAEKDFDKLFQVDKEYS